MVKCSAYRCASASYNKTPGLTFHRFPKDESTRNIWLKNMNRQDWQPSTHSVLCSKHFKDHLADAGSSITRLRSRAIPTLFDELPSATEGIHDVMIKPDPDAMEHEEETNFGSEYTDKNSSSMFGEKLDFNDIAPIVREMSSHLQTMANKQEDSFESFGKYVASLLRNMPERNSREMQLQIVDLLISDPNKSKPSTSAGEKS